jgi:hypothetical protein
MTAPFELLALSTDTFQGPGAICLELKQFAFRPPFTPEDTSPGTVQQILAGLRFHHLLEQGLHKWLTGHFGPIIIEQIEPQDFVPVQGSLTRSIGTLIDSLPEACFEEEETPVDRQQVREKISCSLGILEEGQHIFYHHPSSTHTAKGSRKFAEHHPFCYFHAFLGFNRTHLCLVTLFYE